MFVFILDIYKQRFHKQGKIAIGKNEVSVTSRHHCVVTRASRKQGRIPPD